MKDKMVQKNKKLSGIQVKHHLKEKVYYLIFYPLLLWTKDEKKEYDQTEGAPHILSGQGFPNLYFF